MPNPDPPRKSSSRGEPGGVSAPPFPNTDVLFEFKDPKLLEEALTHSTYAIEYPSEFPGGNERLEFLGDAVLELVTSLILMESFPRDDEGVLTVYRAQLVNRKQLSQLAREIGLGDRLLLGWGEERTGGRGKDTILADALEALIGAMFLDRGLDETMKNIKDLLSHPLENLKKGKSELDAKSKLQEKAQVLYGRSPQYSLVRELGPAHNKVFITRVKIGGKVMGEGVGKSKKESQQRAAEMALEKVLTNKRVRPR